MAKTLDIARAATYEILAVLTRLTGSPPPFLLQGIDATPWNLLDEAAVVGYQLRVGLEDTLTLSDSRVARRNGDPWQKHAGVSSD